MGEAWYLRFTRAEMTSLSEGEESTVTDDDVIGILTKFT